MQELISRIEPALVDFVSVALIALIAFGTSWVRTHTSNAIVNQIIDRASHDLTAFVAAEAQMVDNLRDADGSLSQAAAAQAKASVIAKFKAAWGTDGIAELLKILGIDPAMLDSWLGSRVELAVRTDKTTKVTATVTNATSAS